MVAHLLDSYNHQRILLAGRLMAEGVQVAPKSAEQVVSRLVALIRNIDGFDIARDATEVLGTLFDYPWVADHLGELAALPVLPVDRRASAITGLEHLTGSDQVRRLLSELLPSCYGGPLRKTVPMALRLGQAVINELRDRALALVMEPDADATSRVEATEVLNDLGLESDVEPMARSVFAHPSASSNDLKRAARAWHDAKGQSAVSEVASLATAPPERDHTRKLELAEFLIEVGDPSTATSIATMTFNSSAATPAEVTDAAGLLLQTKGVDAVAEVMNVTDRWSARADTPMRWQCLRLLEHLAGVAPEASVVDRIRPRLTNWQSTSAGADRLINSWLVAEGTTAARKALDLVDQGANLYVEDAAMGAENMRTAGALEEATELAESAIRSIGQGTRRDYRNAAGALLKIDPVAGSAKLAAESLRQPPPATHWFTGVLDALGITQRPKGMTCGTP